MSVHKIQFTDHWDQFVTAQVESGKFKNGSEVVRAGLRLLESKINIEQNKLETLRALVKMGSDQIEQGLGVTIHSYSQLQKHIKMLGNKTDSRQGVNDG